jgi:hypothetical protein
VSFYFGQNVQDNDAAVGGSNVETST